MIAGCYSLDLYCSKGEGLTYEEDMLLHKHDEFPHQYTDEHGSTCRAMARAAGWILNLKTGEAVCPRCANTQRRK